MADSSKKKQLSIADVEQRLGVIQPGRFSSGQWAVVANNAETWAREISAGPFWSEAEKRLSQWRTEYRQVYGGDLMKGIGWPSFQSKTEASIKDKIIRRCKGDLDKVASIFPSSGPLVPCLSDLVRTRIECRYIDGVEFLATKLAEFAKELGQECQRDRQGKIEGYFAQHITVNLDVLYRLMGHTQSFSVTVEIQVASELATRMWQATHGLYEIDRSDSEAPQPQEWQWQPNDPRFISNQLGHMMHLADGLLIHLRDAPKAGKSK